ncbi:MAG TPA: Zn-dependent hydrolase, partial [Rubricoccaceae bacterium]|nr:Zn-dependent hydrolase [Rubricoccaceae bacterium]
NLYPHDLTREEFEAYIDAYADQAEDLRSLYTLVRRDGERLVAVPYHEAFRAQHERAARHIREAARYAQDPGLRRYLELRADALLTDDYQPSDFAWMEMRNNPIDFVVGPIETYEDALFGYKAAHEAYVLLKDLEWSARLQRYAALLPSLQRGLPVEDRYKTETPGSDADLGAYDAIYYAGDSNAGSKTIAINLPNDEEVQLRAGSRRLQLKNVMRAKFDAILVPIAEVLIAPDQRGHVTFDAFFATTMFHEVAHGLGIKNTITGRGTVREALRDQASALEEGKADVLGLYMIQSLHAQDELEGDLMDYYVTFVASIFRSIRFGAASAHGRANLIRFNFFREQGAIEQLPDGTYRVDEDRLRAAADALSNRILTLQGDGDYEAVQAFVQQYGQMSPGLERSLARVAAAGIPVDVVFEQGPEVLGLRAPTVRG